MTRVWTWIKRRRTAIAVVVIALAVGWAIQHSAQQTAQDAALITWHSQLKACDRGNDLRDKLNSKVIKAIGANRYVTSTFLSDAATARRANFKSTHLKSDNTAAFNYQWLANYDNRFVQVSSFTHTDCVLAYPRP